jgi:hypothetical protein
VSHFEEFDRRKAEGAARDYGDLTPEEQAAWKREVGITETAAGFTLGEPQVSDEERRLREALFGLNRALDPDGEGDAFDRLRRARDEVWSLGAELYGWSG